MRSARRHLTSALRVALSLLALALLIGEVGGAGVVTALQGADLRFLVGAWVLFLLGVVVRTFRWRALLLGLEQRPPSWCPPFRRLLRLYLIGGFFNTFLPSGFGGDVVRVLELGQSGRRSAALGTVLVDRLTGLLSLLALGLVVLPFAQGLAGWVRWLFVGVAVMGLVAGGMLLEGRCLRRLTSWLPERFSLVGEGKLANLYAAVTGSGTRAIGQALAFSTLFNLINVTIYWLCARALGMGLGYGFYFVVVPLLSLTLLLPISVGGLGARDWVAQLLLTPTGIAGATVAAWTLSVWAVTVAAELVGGVIYLGQGLAGLVRRDLGDDRSRL